MKHLWLHFRYTVIHKYWVMKYCFKEGLYYRGIMHDMSKFLPDEFFAYARHFFLHPTDTLVKMAYKQDFDYAWLMHQKRNKHHWSYWVMPSKDGVKCVDMPYRFIKEMICDWRGAGQAQKTSDGSLEGARTYYLQNKDTILLTAYTRAILEQLLEC